MIRPYRHIVYQPQAIYTWLLCAKRMGLLKDVANLIAREMYYVDSYFDGKDTNEYFLGLVWRKLQKKKYRILLTEGDVQVVPLILFLLWNRTNFHIALGYDLWWRFKPELKRQGPLKTFNKGFVYGLGTNTLQIHVKEFGGINLVIDSDENTNATVRYGNFYRTLEFIPILISNAGTNLQEWIRFDEALGAVENLVYIL